VFEKSSFPFCSDKTREPRGLVVTTLKRVVAGYDAIVATFGVTGRVSPSIVSSGPPQTTCRAMSPLRDGFYEASKELNPADVFASLERKMSD